jgi:Tfp pilus assembly protein PilF
VSRRAALLCSAALVLLVATIYAQTARHDFVSYDDGTYLYKNATVQAGLTRAGAAWAFGVHANNWHPLTWLSHMLDVELFGLNPGAHHLVSALVHAANAVLLFTVVRRLTGAFWQSLAVAALFAAHPLRVESVAWAAERKDVLSAFFGFLTLGAYLGYVRRPGPRRYLALLLLFGLGLLAKPTFVTLPLLLLLLDWWPLGRLTGETSPRRMGGLVLEKAPLLALSAALSWVTLCAQNAGTASSLTPELPARVTNALVSCAVYLRQTFWPTGLAVLYPFPVEGHPRWVVLASAAALSGIGVAALLGARRHPYLACGWCWYLLALVPVIGLVQVGTHAHADRYTYLPHVGLAIAMVWLAAGIFPKTGRRRVALGAGAVLVVTVLAAMAHAQTSRWRSGIELFGHTAAVTRGNYVILNNLGLSLTAESRADEAIPVLEEALRANPGYVNAIYNLGLAYASTERWRQAMPWFQETLRLTPHDTDAHYYAGLCLLDAGRFAEAADHFRRTLLGNPGHQRARYQLSVALAAGSGRRP